MARVPEKGLAYDVFGPLWAVLDLGAAARAESLTDFVPARTNAAPTSPWG
ncbi:hypothetical protein ABZ835_39255 [Streptomyces sp. NPDC047461]